MISVVVETWNIASEPASVEALLRTLSSQVDGAELVITHVGIAEPTRADLAALVHCPVTWVELSPDAGYYDHKNAGFDASTGGVVAFIDGDCAPVPSWLAAITAPLAHGARVVAGATSYAGPLAPLANELDFPYFDGESPRRKFAATSGVLAPTVRNFFANNVAFERSTFAERRFPTIAPMFHGQCQVLALQLLAAGIPIAYAPTARVTHAWPDTLGEWLETRLLRGADTTQLLPHVLGHYAPRARRPVEKLGAFPALGALPALGILAMRAVSGAWSAVRHGPVLRGLGLVASITAVDALGAAAAPAVYRYLGT